MKLSPTPLLILCAALLTGCWLSNQEFQDKVQQPPTDTASTGDTGQL